jgi:hypothetical protein
MKRSSETFIQYTNRAEMRIPSPVSHRPSVSGQVSTQSVSTPSDRARPRERRVRPRREVEVVRFEAVAEGEAACLHSCLISAGLQVAPVLIGDGVRPFQRPVHLTPVSSSMAGDTTVLRIAQATADNR